jgi:hypothetical protein
MHLRKQESRQHGKVGWRRQIRPEEEEPDTASRRGRRYGGHGGARYGLKKEIVKGV